MSPFVQFLQLVFCSEIDVQIGNGRLNYINGYVAKDHDAVDVGLGEYVQTSSTAPWLASYRLLSKSTPCLPEVAIRMASCSEFDRTYSHVLLYPPQPANCLDLADRVSGNFSIRMYGFYLAEMRQCIEAGANITESFLTWHRAREYDASTQSVSMRIGKHNARYQKTKVVACRYWYEHGDGFWGQFVCTQIPHKHPSDILPTGRYLATMQNFFGMLEYARGWTWSGEGLIRSACGTVFHVDALPLVVDEDGVPRRVGQYVEGASIFEDERAAFEYLLLVARRDLQYRGFRDDRINSFWHKQEANFLLYQRVLACKDDHEFEIYRQSWDTLHRPEYSGKVWSAEQREVFEKVSDAVSIDDEEVKRQAARFLYVKGCPGSGKSAVLIEAAIRSAQKGLTVLIVCPTGALVTGIKLLLPQFDGVDRIHVDTIHGVLKYKRTKDNNVQWAPPSAFRQYDVVFCDEASQYDDREWKRLYQTLREQPHLPYCVVVADFQQLQPVSGGGLCWKFCQQMPFVELKTVYRSLDETHNLFLNRIRDKQVPKADLQEYFGERHWYDYSLSECVQYGLELAKEKKTVFTWLTATNRGSNDVCKAALAAVAVTMEDLEGGYRCDPTSKSNLKILARPGLVLRLSRNLDKQRGFVNGALAVVCESLLGNAVFIARLLSTGNLVLVHPLEEGGDSFLPCCYGYATTIRRAQGASLDMGCIYFDQHRHHAGRGYAYVAVSRFRTKAGCFLYGKLRHTDFLPVGPDREDEVWERGVHSESSDEDENHCEYCFNGAHGLSELAEDGVSMPMDPDFGDDDTVPAAVSSANLQNEFDDHSIEAPLVFVSDNTAPAASSSFPAVLFPADITDDCDDQYIASGGHTIEALVLSDDTDAGFFPADFT